MKLFLYAFQSIRNWTFIGAKMEALLTATWWLGDLCLSFFLPIFVERYCHSITVSGGGQIVFSQQRLWLPGSDTSSVMHCLFSLSLSLLSFIFLYLLLLLAHTTTTVALFFRKDWKDWTKINRC